MLRPLITLSLIQSPMSENTMSLLQRIPSQTAAAACGVLLLLSGCSQSSDTEAGFGQMPPPSVETLTLSKQTLDLTDSLPGRISAIRTAEIRPQVSGIILRRYFTEGATVSAGDKLYQIDPTLYQAALASAEAQLAVAEANAYAAQLKAQRYRQLSQTAAVSAQELDESEAAAKQTQAQVAAAKASVRSARINLSHTEITAPIDGVIGRSNITEGALVSAQQANALATIRQLSPVYVDIQRPAAAVMRMRTQPLARTVTLELDDGSDYPEVGELQFSDISVDQSTGTVNVRAQFDNADGFLLPGMFVRTQVPSARLEHAILVPQQAITRQSSAIASALVVNADNIVEYRVVDVNRAIGNQWLIKHGLEEGERIIVSGLQKVQPGATVNPQDVTETFLPTQPQ